MEARPILSELFPESVPWAQAREALLARAQAVLERAREQARPLLPEREIPEPEPFRQKDCRNSN